MKKIACLFSVLLFSLIISGCGGWCGYPNWTPPRFWNIKISPTTVKRGDKITITYDIRSSEKEVIEALFVDDEWNLLISEDFKNSRPESETWVFEENYNNFVRFNIKVDGAKKSTINEAEDCNSMDYECGGEKLIYHYTKSEGENDDVFPAKYVSSEFGKIVCVVPDNAVSGVLYLHYDMDTVGSYSGEKLIVVDDDGNEINE